MFKPRIFISSTMRDKKKLRNEICNMLNECGAEVLLYEKNLTPSVEKYSYRNEIKDADFVIFIIDSYLGNVTDNNISGLEEEFAIASELNLPAHIYLKKDSKNELVNSIKNVGYSFYYYKSIQDLKKKIKETIFIISNEISLKKLDSKMLSKEQIKNLSFKYDYNFILPFIKQNQLFEKYATLYQDYKENIFYEMFTNMTEWFITKNNLELFNDNKIYDYLYECFALISEYSHKRANEFTINQKILELDTINGKIDIYTDTCGVNNKIDYEWYDNQISKYLKKYLELYNYISNNKLYFDSHNI